MIDYQTRQDRLQKLLEGKGLTALLVSDLANVRYVCGFSGSAGAVVLHQAAPKAKWKCTLFTDARYRLQAREEVRGARVTISKGAALASAMQSLAAAAPREIGFESRHMSVADRDYFVSFLSKTSRRGGKPALHPVPEMIERLRSEKDAEEIDLMRRAARLGCKVMEHALGCIRQARSENDIAAEIEYFARKHGAEAMSFATLVAAGKRSAFPHAVASSHSLPRRGFVVVDMGVILGGYCSDMTRTVHLGSADAETRRMYKAVAEAHQAALEAVSPGVTASEVDHAARRVLQRAGYGKFFSHSTGHGLGLEIHEMPRLARGQMEKLTPGMVITVEPGVYIPEFGGVRIEDMVLITQTGHEVLTPARRHLRIL